jgi:peptidyl-dipeptidase Dcp
VKQVWQQRDTLPPDSESRRLLEITWQRFTLAGATLPMRKKRSCGL